MKVFISVDMEGVSGVVCPEQVSGAGWEYQEARQLYAGDANAAIDGALAGGADEVIVADMHSRGFHFPLDRLHPRAKFLMGSGHWPRFPFLDGSDALFLVGYHARSGTPAAVRDHTMSSAHWQDLWINDRPMGEVGIDAAIAGCLGVPVMLVTGDDKVCAEARALLGPIETVEVKQSVARHRALVLPPTLSQEVIRQGAQRAVNRIGEIKPLGIAGPVEIRLRYTSTDLAERHPPDGDQVVREDGRTVLFRGANFMEVLRRVLN